MQTRMTSPAMILPDAMPALASSVTRISDGESPVPDGVWNEAKRHYTKRQWRPFSCLSPLLTPPTG